MNDESTLTESLRVATKAVADAELPEQFRVAAFERVLDALLANAGLLQPPPGTQGRQQAGGQVDETLSGGGADRLARIAERAGVSLDQIKQVYRLDGDKLSIVVGNKKIDASSAQGSRELTLLVAGGRQAAGIDEEWTPTAAAREVCSRYSRLDSNNYASTVLSMDSQFAFHGQGANRELRLSMPGWEEWQELIQRITGADA